METTGEIGNTFQKTLACLNGFQNQIDRMISYNNNLDILENVTCTFVCFKKEKSMFSMVT